MTYGHMPISCWTHSGAVLLLSCCFSGQIAASMLEMKPAAIKSVPMDRRAVFSETKGMLWALEWLLVACIPFHVSLNLSHRPYSRLCVPHWTYLDCGKLGSYELHVGDVASCWQDLCRRLPECYARIYMPQVVSEYLPKTSQGIVAIGDRQSDFTHC